RKSIERNHSLYDMIHCQGASQSTPCLSMERVNASALSGAGLKSYAHCACGGKLISMDSIRPFVSRPNFVPASYTRLNSTYRPRLRYCHCRCCSVNVL